MLKEHAVDVLLLDISVPTSAENNNIYPILYLIPKLIDHYPNMAILVISMHSQPTIIKNIISAGASGYILKDDRQTIMELPSVVRAIASGSIHFSRMALEQLNRKISPGDALSPRQLEAISLCAAYPDKTTAELARILNVANSTMRNLLSGAYVRLNVHNRPAAISKARKLGILAMEESFFSKG
ncbi:MAG: response regulator transcription factor [Chloroflexi bacterium]|jgi:two-component system, NarL family, nitrate/nitrite response regulator NarL|nr:response regulator transcription factor [Chloroflexota bacterium]